MSLGAVIMKKRVLILPLLMCCVVMGLSGCSGAVDGEGAAGTTAPGVSVASDAAAVLGAWYRIAAAKADGTSYTDDELAANAGVIVFEDGVFTEEWPEETYDGTYTYSNGAIGVVYGSDGDTQTLTLEADGNLTYTYVMKGSAWDGETSTFTRVSPIDGTWAVTAATKADGVAYTDDEVAEEAGILVFDRGAFTEMWAGEVDRAGTFVYMPTAGVVFLTYDDGREGASLTVNDDESTITWQYVNRDPDDEDYMYDGEVYTYRLKTGQ